MDRIKILRYYTKFGYHYRTDNSNIFLMNLAQFLLTEVVCFGVTDWIELIESLEEDYDSTCGNLIRIERKGKFLYLGYVYDDREDRTDQLEISKEELFKLMDTWEKLMEEEPEEIVLIRDNGKFDLIGKNASQRIINENAEC